MGAALASLPARPLERQPHMSATSLPRPCVRPASNKESLLVYRDRVGVPSEIQFLRRQYVAFTRLSPVWVGRHVMKDAPSLSDKVLRLGGGQPTGWLERFLFRQIGRVPKLDIGPTADVLHAQFARGGALALPLAQSLGKRLVVTLHGGDMSKARNWHGTLQSRRWPAVVAAAARFICVSAAVADMALAHGVPRTKIAVLPIGVEPPDRPPAPPAGLPYHLFVGRFVPKKGIEVLADAVRSIRAGGKSTHVVCIGDGPLRPILEAAARDTGSIELTGWLPPEAVARRMAGAWSLLVPSVVAPGGDAEGLPSVIPEAMAQACPVIGSGEGGIAEVVEHGRTGLLVPPGDAVALADAMQQLASQPEIRHALGLAAFAFASEHLNARVQSAALENLLLEFAGN
jgi:colanic acid/amylovoran biosynthesis glycosyltransferase